MKLTLALLFVAFAAGAQSQVGIPSKESTIVGLENIKPTVTKSDSVYFTPKPDQLKTLQQFETLSLVHYGSENYLSKLG